MVQLIVEVGAPPGRAGQDVDPALTAAVRRFGLELQPLHQGVADPSLAGWYVVDVGTAQRAAVLAALRAQPSVLAAYEKPQDAAPQAPAR